MKHDILLKNGIIIPEHELEFSTSRAGGPGGQHVNKTDTRITVRWNVHISQALTDEQKAKLVEKLASRLTADGDLIVHNSESRSQLQNKKMALDNLTHELNTAFHVAKKRRPTRIPKAAKEVRLRTKTHRGTIKKMRSKKNYED